MPKLKWSMLYRQPSSSGVEVSFMMRSAHVAGASATSDKHVVDLLFIIGAKVIYEDGSALSYPLGFTQTEDVIAWSEEQIKETAPSREWLDAIMDEADIAKEQ